LDKLTLNTQLIFQHKASLQRNAPNFIDGVWCFACGTNAMRLLREIRKGGSTSSMRCQSLPTQRQYNWRAPTTVSGRFLWDHCVANPGGQL